MPHSSHAPQRSPIPHHTLLGGVLLFQTRRPPPTPACSTVSPGTPLVFRSFLSLPPSCAASSAGLSTSPFGTDPAFLPSSALYQPTLNVTQYYSPSELLATGEFSPFQTASRGG